MLARLCRSKEEREGNTRERDGRKRGKKKKASEGAGERREKAAVVRCGGGAAVARKCSGTAVVGRGFGSNRGERM